MPLRVIVLDPVSLRPGYFFCDWLRATFVFFAILVVSKYGSALDLKIHVFMVFIVFDILWALTTIILE